VPVTPIAEALQYDVAVLRIKDVPKRLPHLQADVIPLEIAEQRDIEVGEDIVMIGSPIREGMSNQLCLFGNVAETFRGGPVLYQGVAVQEMSGGPMISLESGKVIGIIDQRATDLTGLGKVGDQLSQAAAPATNKQNEGDAVARTAIAEVIQILVKTT
jgi:Trypsin-like peptidase domain